MNIMGMGWQEIMIILVGALIIFGPNRLPEVAGQLGKAIRDLRKMTSDLTGELERTAGVSDIRKVVQDEIAGVKSQMDGVTSGINKEVAGVKKTVSASTSSATSSSTAKASPAGSSATAAKSGANGATSAATRPVASKKDPLADVSFMDEPRAIPATASAPEAAKVDTLDAIGRARHRRQAAGYNRRIAS